MSKLLTGSVFLEANSSYGGFYFHETRPECVLRPWAYWKIKKKKPSGDFLGSWTCLTVQNQVEGGKWPNATDSIQTRQNIRGVREKRGSDALFFITGGGRGGGWTAAGPPLINILYNMFITTFGIRTPFNGLRCILYFYTLAYVPLRNERPCVSWVPFARAERRQRRTVRALLSPGWGRGWGRCRDHWHTPEKKI